MTSQENLLRVKMFGGFSMSWNGRQITGTGKSRDTQFHTLMQIMLHRRDTGVSRDELIELLFEEREVSNVYHSLQTLFYNAKRKLLLTGLPDIPLFEHREGVYFWTGAIPVEEDAEQFERLIQKAEQETIEDKQQYLYADACRLYTGEFLPLQAGYVWVSREARRYRELFAGCVEKAAERMRRRGDVSAMMTLGRYAAQIQPFQSWEKLELEALISQMRYDDAKRLYDSAYHRYMREMNEPPDPVMDELISRMTDQTLRGQEMLDAIQAQLNAPGEQPSGGFLCPYPVFAGFYRMTQRSTERGQQTAYLVLCTAADRNGAPLKEDALTDDTVAAMENAILRSVRKTDIVTRYRRDRYLILLGNTTEAVCDAVKKRISENFSGADTRTTLQYFVNPVLPLSM